MCTLFILYVLLPLLLSTRQSLKKKNYSNSEMPIALENLFYYKRITIEGWITYMSYMLSVIPGDYIGVWSSHYSTLDDLLPEMG